MRRGRRRSRYARRDRDLEYMLLVKSLPCAVLTCAPDASRVTPCNGAIEADHMGPRGLGQKASDRTCVPMCEQHHRERTDHCGAFRNLSQAEVRSWRAGALERTGRFLAEFHRVWAGAHATFAPGFGSMLTRMGALA